MIIQNEEFYKWCKEAITNLENKPFLLKYFHSLYPSDESPVVVHTYTSQATVVIAGNGIVEVDGKQSEISKGDIILINPGSKHLFKASSSCLSLFHIHVPYETMDSDREVVDGNDFEVH